ncbi:MAG: DUF58 domain-containing protein, partial [Candidatus Margulisiibacteriota bacterium]
MKFPKIKTKLLLNTLLKGEYHSIFKGSGIDFHEIREYVPGDDIKLIDWKSTAKLDKPFIKLFTEERELTVFFLIDFSASNNFRTNQKSKKEIALEITNILSFAANDNHDCVGLIIFTDQIELYVPPKKGKKHLLQLLQKAFLLKPKNKKTSITKGLKYFLKINKKKAVIFLISDFIDQDFEKYLKIVSKKHDLIPIIIEDEKENIFPEITLINLKDEETDKTGLFEINKKELEKNIFEKKTNLKNIFNNLKLLPIYLNNNDNILVILNNY